MNDARAVAMLLVARLRYEGWLSEDEAKRFQARIASREDADALLAELESVETRPINSGFGRSGPGLG